jgi:integrase
MTQNTAIINQLSDNGEIINRKIDLATAGLQHFISKHLTQDISSQNALMLSEYILTMKNEINISDCYRETTIKILYDLCKFVRYKDFLNITREDVLCYLDNLRRPETSDPFHKWVGTYNLRRTVILRFFKWLHYPDDEPKKRKIPAIVENIPMLKRREQSIYKPTDLWTVENDLLFLKYCPNKRDRCYHAISRDTSCRPHEILKLRIKDVVFKTAGENYQYAEVLVNGKTGSRNVPLFNSIPYVKDWLDDHIQRGRIKTKRDRKNFGKRLAGAGLSVIYANYKSKYFPALLEDPNVPSEDKSKIRELKKNHGTHIFKAH